MRRGALGVGAEAELVRRHARRLHLDDRAVALAVRRVLGEGEAAERGLLRRALLPLGALAALALLLEACLLYTSPSPRDS